MTDFREGPPPIRKPPRKSLSWIGLKNPKQPLADVLRNRYFKNLAIFRGKRLCWSLFLKKLQACNVAVNIAKFLRTAFLIKHPMAASEKFVNFLGNAPFNIE